MVTVLIDTLPRVKWKPYKVKAVTGNKILRILKLQGLAPTIPEDLYHLIKKGVSRKP